jgi:hypothetical protein
LVKEEKLVELEKDKKKGNMIS